MSPVTKHQLEEQVDELNELIEEIVDVVKDTTTPAARRLSEVEALLDELDTNEEPDDEDEDEDEEEEED